MTIIRAFVDFPIICSASIAFAIGIFYLIFRAAKKQFGVFGAWCCLELSVVASTTAYPTEEEKRDRVTFLQTDPEIVHLIDEGSYVATNRVHLAFSTYLLPNSAMLYLDYIPKTEPADSVNFSTFVCGTVGEMPTVSTYEFENAISNRWVFYSVYTQGPNVHTNGVAVAEFMKAVGKDNVAVPKRATIWENGERVWPSASALQASELSAIDATTISTDDE